MTSGALQVWKDVRANALDQIEATHQTLGGTGRGRRYALDHVNQSYAVLLSSHFQGFCRDLHSEVIDHLGRSIQGPLASIVRVNLALHRQLDSKNPTPSSLGADFNRFGIKVWDEIDRRTARQQEIKDLLDELNKWRNAIAHQNFTALSGDRLTLAKIKAWRRACNRTAILLDSLLGDTVFQIVGTRPW